MHPANTEITPLSPAAERLLDAAVLVFARVGISGATTREIAKEAGVNEVTLFRNFQSKQGLLAEVLKRAFFPSNEVQLKGLSVLTGATVEEVLMDFAAADFERKRRNIALIRVLVGDVHNLGEKESEVLKEIFQPWKRELANRLTEAKELGLIRDDVTPVIVVDQLIAMTFVGALRCGTMKATDYPPETYLKACVETLARGIAAEPEKRRRRP
ncbi:TetR/AcrR family transcriptional regulator [Luteolibacter soli]|uniref:TetR/AcrR family transcriptional regulator n=1 Tax=Luteolibacter soli TaxID=3135280 RepID=A0ABU9AXE8_9BACT